MKYRRHIQGKPGFGRILLKQVEPVEAADELCVPRIGMLSEPPYGLREHSGEHESSSGGLKRLTPFDAFFDDQDVDSPRSNLRTVEYLTAVTQAEHLNLQARQRNPTGQGIHNKMVLAQIGGKGWAVAGNLNDAMTPLSTMRAWPRSTAHSPDRPAHVST